MASTLIRKSESHLHTGPISTLSTVGSTLLSGSRDKSIFEFTASGEILPVNSYAKDSFVTSLKVDRSGTKIISGYYNGTLEIADKESGESKILKGHERAIFNIDLNESNDQIISASADNKVILWNTQGEEISSFTNDCWVYCCKFVPMSKGHVVIGCLDGRVKLIDIENSKTLAVFIDGKLVDESVEADKNKFPVTSIDISADGGFCGYGGKDDCVYILNLEKRHCLMQLDTGSAITALSFAMTRPYLAVGTVDNISVFDIIKSSQVANEEMDKSIKCTALTWVNNSLVAGFKSGELVLYELSE